MASRTTIAVEEYVADEPVMVRIDEDNDLFLIQNEDVVALDEDAAKVLRDTLNARYPK